MRRTIPIAALLVVSALLLSGCSAGQQVDDGLIGVVASTNVYGDIAETIGGDLVTVTSLISDPSQDPHSFEGDARDQLALSNADLVIENGGGYDDFLGTLLSGAGNDDVRVIDAVDLSGYPEDGLNEHVWFDLPTMRSLAQALAAGYTELAPDSGNVFAAHLAEFEAGLVDLEAKEKAVAADGAGVVMTEPVAGYLLEATGFTDLTPPRFSAAIEAETDVPPVVLQQTLDLVRSDRVRLLVYNEQTTGAATDRVLAAAKVAGLPVVAVGETLPGGIHYLDWIGATVDAVASARR
ncbi:zinc ABC transporter substrate-binding protein [soil metagenome]